MPDFDVDLGLALRARYPLLYVETHEEMRALARIRTIASDIGAVRIPREVWVWSLSAGVVGPTGGVRVPNSDAPQVALRWLLEREDPTVLVMLDLHSFLGETSRPGDPLVVRLLRDLANELPTRPHPSTVILISPVLRLPVDLEKDTSLLEFPLPTQTETRAMLDQIIATNSDGGRLKVELGEVGRQRLAQAALGLSLPEASNAYARAIVDHGSLTDEDVSVVLEQKRQMVRASGLLEFVTVDEGLDGVGGLENLKRWLAKRDGSWLPDAAAFGLPAPRGMLLTGVPGCGKSLTAKAVAAAWQMPLLRLDLGRVFAGVVGSSEQNMRTVMRTAEAIAPCVLWIDEVEKGFGTQAEGDSGTSSRVFGSFLTWLQEKTAAVFVVATANRVERLPAEFLRKGRFDEIFFIDLPTRAERAAIWRLHLTRRVPTLATWDEAVNRCSTESEGYSGAEIEQAIVTAMFDAYAERRPVTLGDLLHTLSTMVPLSVTQAEQVGAVRSWAAARAVTATAPEDRGGYVLPQWPNRETGTDDTPPERGGRMVDY